MSKPVNTRPVLALAVLILVYMLNHFDRQILSVLAVPIKAEFQLTDGQLGFTAGIAFGLVYSLLGIPLAWLADRYSRPGVIAVALGVWSLFTALCGLATGYVALLACRIGVAAGEAGGVAPAYALISGLFPSHRRARALAVYSLGIPLGAALGVFTAGLMAAHWRLAFIVAGLAGAVVLPLLLWLRQPVERRAPAPSSIGAAFTAVRGKPTFWLLSLAAGCATFVLQGQVFWFPSLMVRAFHLSLPQAGQFIALLILAGGLTGMPIGGWLADRNAGAKRRYLWAAAVALIVAVPLFAAGLFTRSLPLAFCLFVIPQALSFMWFGPVVSAIQHMAPPAVRSQVASMTLAINGLVGLTFGPWILGLVSDLFRARFGELAITAAFLSCLGLYVVAAGLLALASRTIGKDWVEA